MSKKKSRTSNFSLDLNTKKSGGLPNSEEVEKTIAKATDKEKKTLKKKKIPFTTAITPENRAILEVLAMEKNLNIADILETALEDYFKTHPLESTEMKDVFLKIYQKKLK